jgi:hypothetical protein
MKLNMTLKEYLRILKAYSNIPLTMNRLTLPFGVISGNEESDTLLVGHVLEDLMQRLEADQAIDCIDVAAAAYDLGHEPAGPFLDEAPYILSRAAKEVGLIQRH